ncbi:MAG: glycerophosphodiester phosphodiesterase [Planctomycetales bacterium]|nr:glycerophosphodiester phosphodiesterase [Planctomycetales bacterium]NIM07868.1 glycerophosphodiester phosphodiesterase [Planctomycetales bacterium]NIN07354.1 glycerophosphodiester phosphodiesterase [Planctomycetales bacterium]NIN76458.1 glycerophosphodiester phosphodiesterase [Planctomycetales bacterium]NIO33649.1 glycerophosphodiester phosphodiesterase [Planctomycetales bacterium]
MAFQLIAHRGASHDAPENTLAAVQLAWQQQADAVEIDCRITADGHPVVIHDFDLRSAAGADWNIHETDLARLKTLTVGKSPSAAWPGQQVPTLAEVIQTIPDGKRLLIEIKTSNEITGPLTRTMREAGRAAQQLVVTSYDVGVLYGVRQESPQTTCYLVGRFVPDPTRSRWWPGVDELIRIAELAKAQGLNVSDFPGLDRDFCRTVTATGMELYVWTVDDPQRARQLIDLGVQGLFTNRPGWLREQLKG